MSDDGNQHFFHSEPHTSGVDTGRKRKPPKGGPNNGGGGGTKGPVSKGPMVKA